MIMTISLLAICVSLLSTCWNLGLFDRFLIFVNGDKPGWIGYLPWAYRYYKKHGRWPI